MCVVRESPEDRGLDRVLETRLLETEVTGVDFSVCVSTIGFSSPCDHGGGGECLDHVGATSHSRAFYSRGSIYTARTQNGWMGKILNRKCGNHTTKSVFEMNLFQGKVVG